MAERHHRPDDLVVSCVRFRELVLGMLGGLVVVATLPGGFTHTCSQDARYCAGSGALLVFGLVGASLVGGAVAHLFGSRGLRYFLTPRRWRNRAGEERHAAADANVLAVDSTPAWTAWSALDAPTKDEVQWLSSLGLAHPVEGVAAAARGWAKIILADEQRQGGGGSWQPSPTIPNS